MNEHPSDAAIEAFAMDSSGTDGLHDGAFVAHVSACDRCGAMLTREALLETNLIALRTSGSVDGRVDGRAPKPKRRSLRIPLAVAATVAIAAAIALVSGLSRNAPAPFPVAATRPIPAVVCSDGPAQRRCVEDAHQHGLFVQYPPGGGIPALGGRRDQGTGPEASPFAGR